MPQNFLRAGFVTLIVTVALSGCMPPPNYQQGLLTPVDGSSATAPGARGTEPALPPPATAEPPAANAAADKPLPSLIVTDEPPPTVVYRRGSRDAVLATDENDNGFRNHIPFNARHIETPVTRKAAELNHELEELRSASERASNELLQLQSRNEAAAAEYYAMIAAIATELQSGTTSGNPILIDEWNVAQEKLNTLSQGEAALNGLATDLASHASRANYLLEATQSAFALSGAVKEDHKKLRVIEDGINQTIAMINRLLLNTNDEIVRRITYLRTERANLQTLSHGIAKGELYGQSLTNSLFKRATGDSAVVLKTGSREAAPAAEKPPERRPLVIIRFDRPNVNYDQPLYSAVSQTLEKYPAARFELVTISSLDGNPAQLALSSAEARKNGEAVLRSLTQMGLPIERIELKAASSKDVVNSEVHLYLQ